jgi:hypothetical protein
MKKDLVAQAARNNARWCDAVCRTHGRGGEFHDWLWLHRHGTPRFYPDVVTFGDRETEAQILPVIAAGIDADPGRRWAVKDSFGSLDLAVLGFTPLFDASWICREEGSDKNPLPDVSVRIVRSEAELIAWSKAWSGDDHSPEPSPFKPALLRDPGILFVRLERKEEIVGGGVLSRAAGVVGVSNVFARKDGGDLVWRALIGCAGRNFSGLPLMGYERGEELDIACRNGFSPIGRLRVWHRPE